jgi:hypothetical protein
VRSVLCGLIACVMALPVGANGSLQMVRETSEERVEIDLSSLETARGHVSFRERHTLLAGQVDPDSLRPIREVLIRQILDCRGRRIAQLSRAVFSSDDAMISHQTVQPRLTQWQPIAQDDPVYALVCGHS